MTLPLLHVAQSAAELTMVDRSVVGAGFAGILASVVAIWRPKRWRRVNPLFSRRARLRLFGVVGGVAMFAAVAPMALPVDHMFFQHAESSAASEEVHTSHCHNSPSSCSDMPLVSGPGQFLSAEPLIVAPALVLVLLLVAIPTMRGITHLPEIPPPLTGTTAS